MVAVKTKPVREQLKRRLAVPEVLNRAATGGGVMLTDVDATTIRDVVVKAGEIDPDLDAARPSSSRNALPLTIASPSAVG
jgi:hypothetical protein